MGVLTKQFGGSCFGGESQIDSKGLPNLELFSRCGSRQFHSILLSFSNALFFRERLRL